MIEVEGQISLNVSSEFSEGYACASYFENSTEHLFAELERIDLLLQYRLEHVQNIFNSQDYYRGLYISLQDVERVINKPIGEPWWSDKISSPGSQELKQSLKALETDIESVKIETEKKGGPLNLEKIVEAFSLSKLEKDILLLALSPEIDLRYETMFAYLQDDITKKYLSVDLLINVLAQSAVERIDIRQYLSADSNLVKYRLIDIIEEPSQKHRGLLNRLVKVTERLVNFLLGSKASLNELAGVKLASLDEPLIDGYFHPKSLESVNNIARLLKNERANVFVFIQGVPGSGQCLAATEIAKTRQRKLLCVDLSHYQEILNIEFESAINLIIREAMIENADLYFSSINSLSAMEDKTQSLFGYLSNFSGVIYFEYDKEKTPKINSQELSVFHLELIDLTSLLRAHFWQSCIFSSCLNYTEEDLVYLAERFRFTPEIIGDVILTAKQLSRTKRGNSDYFYLDDLYQACRLNSNRKLESLAKCITPKYQWDDIILEEDKLRQLRSLYNTVLYRTKVYDDWGFADKLSLGKGVNVLFTGPPGTGKTMAAEIVAGNLGLDLYKIDLSTIVSKYIGETEKNLARIFNEAETSNAILFFDEADALFSKRTEIKSSNDRHSNAEVAFLLQRMEEFDGITILATNLRKNIDEAFVRRLAFIIKFPFPGDKERLRIWNSIWPDKTPLSEDVDLDFMASQFKLAGGNIKNIAIASSFLAAECGEKVGMKHIVESTKRELEKQGRTSVKADFGGYGELLV